MEKNNPDYMEKWHENNIEKEKKYRKQYCQNNKEKINKYKKSYNIKNPENKIECNRRYYKKNNIKIIAQHRGYYREKYRTDLKFNLSEKISAEMRIALNKQKNNLHWEDLVKYTLNDLIRRLKKTMPKGYTWDDFLEGKLHVDHIIPISAHNYTKANHIDFKRCWALSNLQLLPAKENLIKHDKLTKPFQPSLAI